MRTAPDIKAEILQKVQREGMTVPEAAKTYGVSRAVIYYWLGQQARRQNIYLIAEVDRLKKELDETHRIIGVLTTEAQPDFMERFVWGRSCHYSGDFRETLRDYELRTGQRSEKRRLGKEEGDESNS